MNIFKSRYQVPKIELASIWSCLAIISFGVLTTSAMETAQIADITVQNFPSLKWDWSKTPVNQENYLDTIKLPQGFILGVGDSDFQVSGIETSSSYPTQNNWTEWELAARAKDPQRKEIGTSTGRWSRWREDIDLIKKCGFNAYRTSVEWSKIEPEEGVFLDEVLEHYKDICKYASEQGLEVTIALWHHTWPSWFGKKDAFEKPENMELFIAYATKVIAKLHPYVKRWITFNEPEAYALAAYYVGMYPPQRHGDFQAAGRVIANMLDAHVKLYKIIKQFDPEGQVGFTKVIQHIDPYTTLSRDMGVMELASGIARLGFEFLAAKFFDKLMNGTILEFFKTGNFRWYVPLKANVSYSNPDAQNSLDYFGLNYYSHTKLAFDFSAQKKMDSKIAPDDEVSDGNRIIYPEGLYRAIKDCALVGKPILICENGVADSGDRCREMYIRKHVYAMLRAKDEIAQEEKVDVIGYVYWTFMNNYEWSHSYGPEYGLLKVDFDSPELTRTMRESSQEFIEFVKKNTGYKEIELVQEPN